MTLQKMFAALSPAARALQLGQETASPLTEAFPRKRVVHAGLTGEMVPPGEAQSMWNTIMAEEPPAVSQAAYIHIPFCKTKCLYCGFFQNGLDQETENRYVDYLLREMYQDARKPRLKNSIIQTVFIGGGTPTSLSAANAKRLLQAIRDCLPLANDYELTLEGRVHDLVPEKMETWLANGVNRMSLGVQSFNTRVRRQLGRLDDTDTILSRLEALQSYRQCSVVIDLIYGLPDQDQQVWEEDLAYLTASGIDGCDLYQLNVFEGSALNRAIQNGRMSPAATTARQAEMFAFAHKYLTSHHYKRLSSCHWAANNRERSLYNSLAKKNIPMFQFGCGAGGSLGGCVSMNHRMLAEYEALVEAGQKPFMALMREHPLKNIISQVNYQLEHGFLNLDRLVEEYPALQELQWLYEQWERRGLTAFNGVLYELTVPGQFWQINIAQTTLECIQALLTGKTLLSLQRIAAQDGRKDGDLTRAVHHKAKKAGKEKQMPAAGSGLTELVLGNLAEK
ncbi:MAG: heme anaerobic degradation radical SAM methyltransferase ChuW/HutW [Anaerovibrio sp.]|nr:heme anaerobic degradation radical SAM methyltransferase ChuW/HutW [Anaerovibrio sp.]